MNAEQLKELLREHLEIKIEVDHSGFSGPMVEISILYDGEKIDSDFVHVTDFETH